MYVVGSCGIVWEHAGGALVMAGGGEAGTVAGVLSGNFRAIVAGGAWGRRNKRNNAAKPSSMQTTIQLRRFMQTFPQQKQKA